MPLATTVNRAVDATPNNTTTESTTSSILRSRCSVCYTDLVGKTAAVGITQCHHDEICGLCHLRLRQLHNDCKCPICKAVNETVIVDYVVAANANKQQQQQQKQYEDYPVWGDDLGSDFVHDHGMFFPVDYYHNVIKPLSSYQCTIKECGFTAITGSATAIAADAKNEAPKPQALSPQTNPNLRALQDHLRVQHRLTLCQLCVDNKRDFVARLPRYSPSGLQRHVAATGNGQQEGHPVCEFCRPQRFYDVTALHMHLNQEHYKCHVCEIANGLSNQFYKNYQSLEHHFEVLHYLCPDPQCLAARFVVFANELDLRLHERQVHGGRRGHLRGLRPRLAQVRSAHDGSL